MKNFNDFIDVNEEIKFIGTYDIKNINLNPGDTKISGTWGVQTDVAGICEYSFINFSYYYAQTGLIDAPRFTFTNYSLASVENLDNEESLFLGNCVFEGSRPNRSINHIGDPSIFAYGVSTATGIYKGITKVILDFTNPTRVLYFITDKVNVLTN